MRLTVIFLYNLLTSTLGVYTKLFNPSIYCRSLEYLRSLYLQKSWKKKNEKGLQETIQLMLDTIL